MPVGAANVYWPCGHADRCVEQPRSDDTVGFVDSHSPCLHTVSGAHAAPSFAPDHVPCAPAAHASQTRLAVALPAVFWPWPAGHVRHATQSWAEPEPAAEKVPAAQAVHAALVDAAQKPALHCVHEPAPSAAA